MGLVAPAEEFPLLLLLKAVAKLFRDMIVADHRARRIHGSPGGRAGLQEEDTMALLVVYEEDEGRLPLLQCAVCLVHPGTPPRDIVPEDDGVGGVQPL